MVLEAANQSIKNKWIAAIKGETDLGGGIRRYDGRLLAEGYVTKVQSGASSNRVWVPPRLSFS